MLGEVTEGEIFMWVCEISSQNGLCCSGSHLVMQTMGEMVSEESSGNN